MCITHEDVNRELRNKIINYKVELERWKNVTFNCKKDGTPFQNLKKCFNGANYGFGRYDERHERPELTIYYCTDVSGYLSSSLGCTNKDKTFMTFDQIKVQIRERMAYLEAMIQNCEEELKTVESWLNELDSAVSKVADIIKKGNQSEYYLFDYAERKLKSSY